MTLLLERFGCARRDFHPNPEHTHTHTEDLSSISYDKTQPKNKTLWWIDIITLISANSSPNEQLSVSGLSKEPSHKIILQPGTSQSRSRHPVPATPAEMGHLLNLFYMQLSWAPCWQMVLESRHGSGTTNQFYALMLTCVSHHCQGLPRQLEMGLSLGWLSAEVSVSFCHQPPHPCRVSSAAKPCYVQCWGEWLWQTTLEAWVQVESAVADDREKGRGRGIERVKERGRGRERERMELGSSAGMDVLQWWTDRQRPG